MGRITRLLGVVSVVWVLAGMSAHAAAHTKSYWQLLVAQDGKLPDGSDPWALAQELSGYLGHPDPELRDDVATTLLTNWIYQQQLFTPEQRRTLLAAWKGNLARDLGSRRGDSTLRRSFSALMLSIMVASDNEQPFLEAAEIEGLLAAALGYLAEEHDLRGYDPQRGWIHSAAHTADLLKFLARSRHLTPSQQQQLLLGIADKMGGTAGLVFTWGEDLRFARAVLSIVRRDDLSLDAVAAFLTRCGEQAQQPSGAFDPKRFAAAQNVRQLLQSSYLLIAALEKPTDAQKKAGEQILAALLR